MIEISDIVVQKSNINILNILNINIDVNKSTAIFGENGVGKTTLIKCILGIEEYTGSIKNSVDEKAIQVLMQNNSYPPYAKTKDIIRLILNKKDLSTFSNLFEMFNFEQNLNKKISVLSGGELQKLNLILIFAIPHELLIVDEVTTGLDFETRKKLVRYINNYRKEKSIGLIIVSHYLEEIKALCDEVLYLEKGVVAKKYTVEEFLEFYKREKVEHDE